MNPNTFKKSLLPSLTLANSSSGDSTKISNPSTPRNSPLMFLKDIFREMGLSPPSNSENALLNDIKKVANEIMDDVFSWERLDSSQQTRLGFLIFKKQTDLLSERNHLGWIDKLKNAVFNEDTSEYKALTSFIQKGGDQQQGCTENWQRERDEIWRENNDKIFCLYNEPTGFNHQYLEPFVRFQTNESVVCWIICASNAILHYMMITTGTKRDEAIGQYGINIGRFMRNCLTNEEVFQTIFFHNGGYPEDLMERLLSSATPSNRKEALTCKVFSVQPQTLSVETVFDITKSFLSQRGSIIVSNFRVFPSYTNVKIKFFGGSYHEVQGEHDAHHALLITSVRKTEDGSYGGIVFEMSDSLQGRPFVNIGLDLLSSMNVQYKGIDEGVVFHGTSNENGYDLGHIPASPTSGSTDISASFQGLLSQTPTVSDLTSGTNEQGQEGNDVNISRAEKPDWMGIEIQEGIDPSRLVLIT